MSNSTPYNFTQLDQLTFINYDCNSVLNIWNFLQFKETRQYTYYEGYDTEEGVYHSIMQGFEAVQTGLLDPPTMDEEFWKWATNDSNSLHYEVFDIGWEHCPKDMCKALGWEGSPDLAGVGMLATYIIQAVLVTVYIAGILTIDLKQRSDRPGMWPPLSRILCAVLDTTREFLSSSAIFTLALLVASVYSVTQDDAYDSSTTWILLLVIPLYSVLAVLVLHLAAWEMLQRYKGRVLVLLFIDVMVIVLAVRSSLAYNGKGYGWGWKHVDPSNEESPCLKVTSFNSMAIFFWTVAGILCFGVTAYLVDYLVSLARHRPGLVEQLPGMIRWAIISLGLCAMWYLIGWFVKLTLDIRSRAGENNADNRWTFGQVLALSTWAPFLIEFGYNIWEGPKKANEAHSNYPSKSVLQDSFAMRSPGGDEERGRFALLE